MVVCRPQDRAALHCAGTGEGGEDRAAIDPLRPRERATTGQAGRGSAVNKRLPARLRDVPKPAKAAWVGDWEEKSDGTYERPYLVPGHELSAYGKSIRVELHGIQYPDALVRYSVAINGREKFLEQQADWVLDAMDKLAKEHPELNS